MTPKPLKSRRHDRYLSSVYTPESNFASTQSSSMLNSPYAFYKNLYYDIHSSPCGSASNRNTVNPSILFNENRLNILDSPKREMEYPNQTNLNSSELNYQPNVTIFNSLCSDNDLNFDANDLQLEDLDSMYTAGFENETFNSSTSYELDSNLTSRPRSTINLSNDSINPLYYHSTPSPSEKNSIRIVTSSNRIVKLKDQKLLNAIYRSINIKDKLIDSKKELDNNNNENKKKSLNEEQSHTSQNRCQNAYSDLPIKKKFIIKNKGNTIHISKVNKSDENSEKLENEEQERVNLNNKTQSQLKWDSEASDYEICNNDIRELLTSQSDEEYCKHKSESHKHCRNDKTELTFEPQLKSPMVKLRKTGRPGRKKGKNLLELDLEKGNDSLIFDSDWEPEQKYCKSNKSDVNIEIKKAEEKGEKDIVLDIFRESMKKNKDNFIKKPRHKSKPQVPKVTKLHVPRMLKNSKNTNSHEEKGLFRCSECPKVFKQRSQWKRHVDCIHLKIAKFICVKCNKAFKRSDHLKNHIRRIHGAAAATGKPTKGTTSSLNH